MSTRSSMARWFGVVVVGIGLTACSAAGTAEKSGEMKPFQPPIGVDPGGTGNGSMNWIPSGTAETYGMLSEGLVDGLMGLKPKVLRTGNDCPVLTDVEPLRVTFSVTDRRGDTRQFRILVLEDGPPNYRWERYIDGEWKPFAACFHNRNVPPSCVHSGIPAELWGTLSGEMKLVYKDGGTEKTCDISGFAID